MTYADETGGPAYVTDRSLLEAAAERLVERRRLYEAARKEAETYGKILASRTADLDAAQAAFDVVLEEMRKDSPLETRWGRPAQAGIRILVPGQDDMVTVTEVLDDNTTITRVMTAEQAGILRDAPVPVQATPARAFNLAAAYPENVEQVNAGGGSGRP